MLFFALGLVLGAAATYLVLRLVRPKADGELTECRTRLAASEALLVERDRALERLDELIRRVGETVKAGAFEAIRETTRQVKTEADLGIENHKKDIEGSVAQMRAKIDECRDELRRFEQERHQIHGRIENALRQVLGAEQAIQLEAGALKQAMISGAVVTGSWGERYLQQILEQGGLVRGLHFDLQVSCEGEEGALRPDCVVKLPGGKRLVIDAKNILADYVKALEKAADPLQQRAHHEQLVAQIRQNFTRLSGKSYQSFLDPDVPYVVMFVPSEPAIRAAFSTDPGLFDEAAGRKVILASPMTLMPLIYLIANAWQQHQLAGNALDLSRAVEELGNRLEPFVEHLRAVASGIRKTAESWNKAVASWQRKVEPQLERTRELGGRLGQSEAIEPIEAALLPDSPERAKGD